MRAACALGLLIAACDGSGLAIEVAAPGATHVEVFFAGDECEGCANAIATKASSAMNVRLRAAHVWHPRSKSRFLVEVEDGAAQFKIETPKDEYFPRVYFVAFAGEVPKAVARLDDFTIGPDAKHRKIELAAAEPIAGTDAKQADGVRLEAWSKADRSLASCLVYERWKENVVDREMIVNADDLDCDDVDPLLECDRTWYRATGLPANMIASATCALNEVKPPGITNTTCVLGGGVCSDGAPQMPSRCDAPITPTTCLPDALCTAPCASIEGCVTTNAAPYVECVFPADANNTICPSAKARLDLGPLRSTGSTACAGSVLFANPSLVHPMFTPSLVFNGGGMLTASALVSGCGYDLTLAGTVTSDRIGLVKVRLSNATHTVMPLRVKILQVPACDQQPICGFANFAPASDGIVNCAAVPL